MYNVGSTFLMKEISWALLSPHCNYKVADTPFHIQGDNTVSTVQLIHLCTCTCGLTLQLPNYLIDFFTHLKLSLADAIHNFKWAEIVQVSQYGGERFWNLVGWCHVFPLTAGAAYLRVFIFYYHIKYYLLNVLKIKSDINQQYLKTVDLHFVKSE